MCRSGLFAGLFLAFSGVAAQPVCSIEVGPDTTICQGQTVRLSATPGFPNYLWSTGGTTPDIMVGAAGTYWCDASYPTGELVVNGDFSGGNTGFTTDFTYDTNLNLGDGHYWIGTNARNHHPQFSGTGSGNFMIVNAGWDAALFMVWCQSVPVCPGQTYTISYRARTLSNATPARLQWWIDGAPSGPEVDLPVFGLGWQTITHSWTSPPTAGPTASFCLRAMSGEGVGNDFGLDDISITSIVVLRDGAVVQVIPLPLVDLGPDTLLCAGETLALNVTRPGGGYIWQDGSTAGTYTVTSPGPYSVTVTVDGCSNSDAILVSYTPLPVVDLGPDTVLCAGQTLVLNATRPGATYLWQNGSTAPTFTVSGPGNYGVTVTVNGCSASDDVNVAYTPLPTVGLGPDRVICTGAQTLLDATTPGGTYLWQDGSTGATYTVTAGGTYTVTVTVNGCSASDAVNVTLDPLPQVDLGPARTLCAGDVVTLNATWPGASHLWSTGATTPTLDVSASGTYWVRVDLNGCIASDTVRVTVLTPSSVDLGPDLTLCQGETAVLDATTPGATYLWSTGAATPSITVGSAGTYWVEVSQGACSASDTINVTVLPVPQVDLGPDRTLCAGDVVTLNAAWPSASYLWSTGATTSSIDVSTTGTYGVQVDLNGCMARDTVRVTVLTPSSVDLGPDLTLCLGETAVLDAITPGATYLWSTGAATPSITVGSTGTYWVEVSQGACSASDTIMVTVLPVPQVDLGPDRTLCAGDVAMLNATWPGASYLWSTVATTPTLDVSASGTYWVRVDLNGCIASDTVRVTVLTPSLVDLGPDLTLCLGVTAVLDAMTPGATYLWSTGAITPSISVGSTGTYWVEVSQGACSASDTINVTVLPVPQVDLGPDRTLCTGASLVLDATLPGAAYLWDDGSTNATRTVSATGAYWVRVTVGPCAVGDTVRATFNPLPVVDLGPDVDLCPGGSASFDATTPGGAYRWHNGSTSPIFISSGAGQVRVAVTVNGCSASDSAFVRMVVGPAVDLGRDTTLCEGSTLTLDATQPGGSYLWENGATTPTRNITGPGTYGVRVERNGCFASDSIRVSYITSTSVDLGPDIVLCPGRAATLRVLVPGADVLWSTGATSSSIVVSEGGIYWAEVRVSGCTVRDSVDVRAVDLQAPTLGRDTLVCLGDTVTLSVTPGNASVLWSTGSMEPVVHLVASGIYTVTLSLEGCTASDTVIVTVRDPIDVVDLGPDRRICPGQTVLLNAPLIPGATYLWDTGDSGPVLAVERPGTYMVAVAGLRCVDATGTVEVVEGECAPDVYVPNAFTPNGDGINDVFRPSIEGTLESFHMEIFDRWGERVHATEDLLSGWDGHAGGVAAQDGVYVWSIHYRAVTDEGVKRGHLIGHVVLLR